MTAYGSCYRTIALDKSDVHKMDRSEEVAATTTALHPTVSALEEPSRKLLLCWLLDISKSNIYLTISTAVHKSVRILHMFVLPTAPN